MWSRGDTVQEKNVLIVTCSKWYLYYEWIIVTESKLWDSLISMALVGSATCECCSESREKILMLMLLRTCRFCFYIIQIWANTGLFLHNLIYIDQPKLIKCPGGTCGPDTIFKPKLYASRLRQDMNQKWFFLCVAGKSKFLRFEKFFSDSKIWHRYAPRNTTRNATNFWISWYTQK